MKKLALVLLSIIALSCEKQESCRNYQLIVESSIESAINKCSGLANSHPQFKTVEMEILECLTKDELKLAQSQLKTTREQLCNGVFYEIRTTIR